MNFFLDCCNTWSQFAGLGLILLGLLGFASIVIGTGLGSAIGNGLRRARLWALGAFLKAIGENPDDFR